MTVLVALFLQPPPLVLEEQRSCARAAESNGPASFSGQACRANASGCGENLDRHRLVSNRARVDRPATRCALARHLEQLENRGPARGILAYAPEGATCAYLGPDRKRLACRSPLDIAVREPKNQERRVRHAENVPEPADDGLLRFSCIDTLHVDDLDELLRDPSDKPEHAPSAHRVADRRNGASRDGEVVLEVAVRETDHERSAGHQTPLLPSGASEVFVSLSLETAALRESASEEGAPSGNGLVPERSRCAPLLESCGAMPPATRRHDAANESGRAAWTTGEAVSWPGRSMASPFPSPWGCDWVAGSANLATERR